MELYIIRHGETDWNKKHILQGQSDVPLNENGRNLAVLTGKAISDIHFDIIYASPLIRAYETAQLMTGKDNIITDDRLKEVCFGVAEGKESHSFGDDFSSFFFAPEKYVPVENAESFESLCKRAGEFLADCIYPKRAENINVAIFAHGAVNKALMKNLKNIPLCDFWKGEYQKNCCINHYRLTADEIYVIDEAKVYY